MAFQPGFIAQQTLAGRTFIGTTTSSGITPPAHNATSQVFGLWNPAGSNRYLVLDKFTAGIISLGTEALAALTLSKLENTGGNIATGAPISAFTGTDAVNGLIGGGENAGGRFTLSATITAPTLFYDLGISNNSTDLSSAVEGIVTMQHDFGGTVVVPPGVYVGLGGTASPGLVVSASLSWYETDVA